MAKMEELQAHSMQQSERSAQQYDLLKGQFEQLKSEQAQAHSEGMLGLGVNGLNSG